MKIMVVDAMNSGPAIVLIVEDQAPIELDLRILFEEAGCRVMGPASSLRR